MRDPEWYVAVVSRRADNYTHEVLTSVVHCTSKSKMKFYLDGRPETQVSVFVHISPGVYSTFLRRASYSFRLPCVWCLNDGACT